MLLVRKGGLEPPHLAALEPKSSASTNSATFAIKLISFHLHIHYIGGALDGNHSLPKEKPGPAPLEPTTRADDALRGQRAGH